MQRGSVESCCWQTSKASDGTLICSGRFSLQMLLQQWHHRRYGEATYLQFCLLGFPPPFWSLDQIPSTFEILLYSCFNFAVSLFLFNLKPSAWEYTHSMHSWVVRLPHQTPWMPIIPTAVNLFVLNFDMHLQSYALVFAEPFTCQTHSSTAKRLFFLCVFRFHYDAQIIPLIYQFRTRV